MANMLSAMQQFPGMGMGQQMQERQQQAQMMPAQMDPQRQQAQMMPAQMDPQRQQAQQQSASMMPERPQQAFPAVNQSFDPQMQQMMQERQQQALMQESPAFPQQMQQQARQRQMQQMIQQRQDTSPQQMQMQQNNIQRMQQAAPQLVPQQQPTMTGSLGSPIPQDLSGSLGSPIPQDLSGAGSQMMQASQGLGHLAPEQQQAQMRQAFMERSQQGPPPMQQGLGNSTPPMQQAQQFLTPEQMSGQQQLRDPNGPRPQLMGALSSNDLQRQLNRGAVVDENVGNVKSEITALNNASFTANQAQPPSNQAQPPSNQAPPTPFFNRPEFEGIFGGGSDPRAAGQPQPQSMTGPNPSQIPQAPPQQQMAGGYGLSNYQDDKFSKGVMSLPQIQENFYSPPPGNYTAPAIQSPYQMF